MTVSVFFAGFLIIALPVMSTLILLLRLRDARHKRVLIGVQLLQAGRALLTHLQQHRGLSAARYVGVTAASHDISDLQSRVLLDMRQMSAIDDWLVESQDWQGITRHWASLSTKASHMPGDDSFSQHSKLIAALISLLDDIASHFGLDGNYRYLDNWLAWREYLRIGEHIGQCRALGVQFLAELSAERSRVLVARMQQNLHALDTLLESAVAKRHIKSQTRTVVLEFIAYLRDLLIGSAAKISMMDYYANASAVIETVYENFDMEMRKLHRRLTN